MVEDHFAQLYHRTDRSAALWQSRFLWTERIQLGALILAAVAANFGRPGLVIAIVAFATATLVHLLRFISRADQRWWNGRAGAESAKTLCWRYSVGGAPFPTGSADADRLLLERLTEIATRIAETSPVAVGQGHISPEMRQDRALPLGDRVQLYQDERIRGQMAWYDSKCTFNGQRALRWTIAAIAAQVFAIAVAVVGVVRDWSVDYIGIFSAVAASATAWASVKQFEVLARSYAVAANELASIDSDISARQWTEQDWAPYVDNAEEAISREHTSWRASRGI